eukprot:147311-Chlamydomonas_euryale.AAC.1
MGPGGRGRAVEAEIDAEWAELDLDEPKRWGAGYGAKRLRRGCGGGDRRRVGGTGPERAQGGVGCERDGVSVR